jgi:hypothetical protein
MNSINKKLYELYASKWSGVSESLLEIVKSDNPPDPTNPLLLQIDKEEEWEQAGLRVMIFGQETRDWKELPDKPIEHLLDVYNRGFNTGNWNTRTPFWHGFARFKSLLDAKYPDKNIRYVWNNIIKIGKEGESGRPPQNIYEVEREYFHVIPDEIKILKPDILLFLTGPSYDDVIHDNFGDVTYCAIQPYDERTLAKVLIPEINFAFRTHHPTHLRLTKQNINDYFNAIIDEITY